MTAIRGPGGPKGPGGAKRLSRGALTAEKGTEASKGASGAAVSAKVSLSKDVKLMDEARASLDSLPVVDAERVAALKALVNSGDYKPNLDVVADGLIEEAILRSLR